MAIRSRLQEARAENPLVPLALGAISLLAVVARAAREPADPPAEDALGPCRTLEHDDPFVLAALGLLSLERSLLGWLAGEAPAPHTHVTHDPHTTAAARPPHDPPTGLTR